jgi:hypothetical protein
VSERPPRPTSRPGAPPPGRGPQGQVPGRPGGGLPGRPAAGQGAGRQPTPPGRQSAPAAAQEGPSDVEPQLDDLERRIERLQLEFRRYFAGDLERPPDDLRAQIEQRLRSLRGANLRRSVDNFRLGSLEARYSSYNEMFNRRLRAVEEGRVPPRRIVATPVRQHYDAEAGVLLGARAEQEAVEALFQGLVACSPRGATMDLDTFRGYLEKQVAQIREKTGCSAVQFRVLTEEGKVKIKAKPVGSAGGGAP